MKIEREYKIGVREIGGERKISNIGMLGFLEEIAAEHSALVGYGINDIPNTRKTWLLMDWKLKIIERPNYGDNIKVITWSRIPNKLGAYTYRDFEVYCKNKLVAIATSKWIMVDVDTEKIVRMTEEIIGRYESERQSVFKDSEIDKVKESKEFDNKVLYEIRKADIDINKHVHNLNYLNLACEVLPEEIEVDRLNNIRIMYKHQITYNDKVQCLYKRQEDKNIITIKSEDGKVLHAVLELF